MMITTDASENQECTNSKAILEQLGPIDKLLGSVSYNEIDSVEGRTQQLRTSARVFKKMKFDLTVKKEEKEEPKAENSVFKIENKKAVSPLWTSEEKRLFFEGLNEYGKNFENIHLYLSTRLKKKGIPEDEIKTKNQSRRFYYKISRMLLSYLKFSDQLGKSEKELYALINYGEMRRKIGSVQKKNWPKLNELICHGSISLRIKGKTIRVKTPMCRALRRINQLDEKYDDLKLPTRVLVEMKPKDMSSFLKVQSFAQNPRIRMSLSLQKRLSSVLSCISNRWKSTEAVIYDNAIVPTNVVTKECVPDRQTIESNSSLLNDSLRLTPPSDVHIEIPTIDISEYFSGQSICLTAFEARKGVKSKSTVDDVKKEVKEEDKSTAKAEENVSTCVDEAVSTILALKKPPKQPITEDKKSIRSDNESKLKEIANGWTIDNCHSITIGEMYLMFGTNSKLPLEYSWQSPEINVLSHQLKKLLSIAQLNPSMISHKCSCGHVCGAPSKGVGVPFKRPISTKVVKKHQIARKNVILKMKAVVNGDTSAQQEDPYKQSPPSPVTHLFTQLDVVQRLSPKFRNRRRPLSKQLVVERKLVPNKSENNHQIVSMDIIAQESPESSNHQELERPEKDPPADSHKTFSGVIIADTPSSNSSISGAGLSRLLKETSTDADGNQWGTTEVGDYSLSSLLGHLDCTSNKIEPVAVMNGDSQLPTSLMEASVDYTAKFADLTAQAVDGNMKSS